MATNINNNTLLNCYCDHCANNTCTTSQLCYAEWKLVSTTTSSVSSSSSYSSPATDLRFSPMKLERKFNCFNKDHEILINTVCNESVTNTSHTIRRCCRTGDYCNRDTNLLPSESEALQDFSRYMPQNLIDNGNNNFLSWLSNQYSYLPLGIQITLIILILMLFAYAVTLVQGAVVRRRRPRRWHQPVKWLGHFFCGSRQHGQEPDLGENSSFKANSDVAVLDTNSMTSREPLIGHRSRHMTTVPSIGAGTTVASDLLTQQHPGPYMAGASQDDTGGRTQSTFQMTLGSAAGDRYKQDSSSGSGAGQPYLTQRSIAHDIQLIEVVGRGFFGVVWRGEYKGEPIAVKIFSPVAEPSWEREAEIYQTTMLRHKNILGFIASDKRHDAALTGYWLVTDYYPMGSLYDFLRDNTLSMVDAIRMAFSIANGLSHLHIEIFGTKGKPAIAHRDLKSKNVLVKNDGTCCIADLGMAVRYNSHSGIVDVPTNTRIGTRRYLAPEILEQKLNLMDFESVKSPDIYALGLVLWEILRRTCLFHPSAQMDPNFNCNVQQQVSQMSSSSSPSSSTAKTSSGSNGESAGGVGGDKLQETILSGGGGQASPAPGAGSAHQVGANISQEGGGDTTTTAVGASEISANKSSLTSEMPTPRLAILCEPYEPPYGPYVPADPTAEEMREVVCVRRLRPEMSPRWAKFASMRDYVNLMTECWYDKPQARLSALRVRKSISDVAKKHFNMHMEYD